MPKSITFFSRGKTPIYVNYVIAHNNVGRPLQSMYDFQPGLPGESSNGLTKHPRKAGLASCHFTVLSPGKGSTCPSTIFLWSQEKDAGQAQDDADDLSGQQDVFIQQDADACQKERYADISQERGHTDFPTSPV